MGLIVWAIVAGALFGSLASDFSQFGLYAGGAVGAAMGAWLRSAVRHEIDSGVRAALADMDLAPAAGQAVAAPRPAPQPLAQTAPPGALEPEMGAEPEAPAEAARAVPVAEQSFPDEPDETISLASRPDVWRHAPAITPAINPAEALLERARAWLLGGNTIARVGLAVLFVGLVFLARLAVNAGLYPIEARLATVAAVGVALLTVGLRKRVERPAFGLLLQGGGVAVLYLVIFAAARVYEVMPPLAAFAFMILFAGLGCALALLQDALVMALASFLGGYAVPVLLGGRSETPLGLFTYMTILNLAVLVIAGRKSWRSLNLLGFVATFALAAIWGFADYEDRHFLLCQAFLIVSVAIYLATALLYAHNTPGKLGNYADSTLLFGTALAGFGLQAALVHGRPFAAAFAALGFAAAYLGSAALAMRQDRPGMRVLNESLLAIGVGFVTLAVPLALEGKWISSTWALEGAGAFWVGARQARWMPRAFGLALQAAAGAIAWFTVDANISAMPLANSGFLIPALVALPALLTAWLMRHPLDHSGSTWARSYAPVEHGLRQAWFLGGFLFVCVAIGREAARLLPAPTTQDQPVAVLSLHGQAYVITAAILAAMAAAQWLARHRDWAVAAWPSRLGLPLVAICFLTIVVAGRHVLTWPDAAWWVVILALHGWVLRHQPADGWTAAMHTGGVVLLTSMIADSLYLAIDRGDLWDTSWAGVVFLVSATAVLAGLTRWAGKAAPLAGPAGLSWPRDPFARAYWWRAGLVLALLVYAGAMLSTLLAEGVTDPLPYIPLLNAVDLSALLALAALAQWRRMVFTARDIPPAAAQFLGGGGLAAGAILAFAIVNTVWLRTAHHFLGIGWNADELAANQVVQSGYSLLWTLIAMGLMLFAQRRAQRLSWLIGATLLGAVVAKLFLVDMSKVEGVARIVAFIGVGVLMLMIGYLVPLPPRQGRAEEEPA